MMRGLESQGKLTQKYELKEVNEKLVVCHLSRSLLPDVVSLLTDRLPFPFLRLLLE